MTHLPIYKNFDLLELYKFEKSPISINKTDTQIMISPEHNVLAINEDKTLYNTYQEQEIIHNCKALHNVRYCQNANILKRTSKKNCLLAMYTKDKNIIKSHCSLQLLKEKEIVYQLSDQQFYIFTAKPTEIDIKCRKTHQKQLISKYNIIQLEPNCKASIKGHIISTGVNINLEEYVKQTNLHLNVKELININKEEEGEFVGLLEELTKLSKGRPIPISRAKQKFHLKIIQRKHKFLRNTFSITSTVIVLTIIVLSIAIVRRYCRNKQYKRQLRDNTNQAGTN